MGVDTFTKWYHSSISSILKVCGHCKAPKIETVQNRAMRIILSVPKFAANYVLLGD
jgi:hypothetical protein